MKLSSLEKSVTLTDRQTDRYHSFSIAQLLCNQDIYIVLTVFSFDTDTIHVQGVVVITAQKLLSTLLNPSKFFFFYTLDYPLQTKHTPHLSLMKKAWTFLIDNLPYI